MEIAIIAHNERKELMAQFCIAYCGILCKHSLCATAATGKYIADATGLDIETYMGGSQGGIQQISSRISLNEIDIVLFFRDSSPSNIYEKNELDLLRLCDSYNIPVATNIATAEAIIMSLSRGDLDWRNYVDSNSRSI